ncbi:mucin-3A-like, partial [Penaeus japonicus]|uniref:mucin-3A-like n=1 Tax=Penaeus japonicus TaxID=27405 RepID=UPI001C710665
MDDLKETLHKLYEGERSHCVLETVYSQNSSDSNSSWYYMDEHDVVWLDEEEYPSDVHIGHGLLVVLPPIAIGDSIVYIAFMRTFLNEPASPIVQIYQSYVDQRSCGCKDAEEGHNSTHDSDIVNVIQHFSSESNFSVGIADMTSVTDYIMMLDAVPSHQRQVTSLIIENEIEGDDCETTTVESTSTTETTSGSTTTIETSTTPEVTTSTIFTSPETSTTSTVITSSTETASTTTETTTVTSPETTTVTSTTETASTTPETTAVTSTFETTTVTSTTETIPTTPEPTTETTTPESTTLESTTTTISTALPPVDEEIDPVKEEKQDTIVEILQSADSEDCGNDTSEVIQSVVIDNEVDMDDLKEALHRLRESEPSYCIMETIFSQNSLSSDNSSWYYMNDHEVVWMDNKEYESDVHIGYGLVIILPVLSLDGTISFVVLVRTFVDKPASPIVQIYQSFRDQSACGCIDDDGTQNATHEHGKTTVIQHFISNYNYSQGEIDLDIMTDYIEMLEAVPEHQRTVSEITIVDEIEGEDCDTTETPTTTESTMTTIETTMSETTSFSTTHGPTTTPEFTTTPESTTTTSAPTEFTTTSVSTTTSASTKVTTISTSPEFTSVTSTTPETTSPTPYETSTTSTRITPETTTPSISSEATTSPIPETTTTSMTPEATTSIIPDTTETSTTETTTTEPIPTEPSSSTTVTTIPTPPPIPVPDEDESIVQILQNNENVDCDNISSEIVQSVEIINEVDKDDLQEALHRLKEGEQGHCVIETIFSQNSSNSDNSSWYYMDQQEIVWMDKEEEFQSEVHVGFGLVIVFPLVTLDGRTLYVVLMRTFVDEPASPIVQIYQSFNDRSACGCIEGEESDNTTHEHGIANVIQHFTSNSNYSHEEVDMNTMTDYIEMLFAVPEHQRKITEMVIANEIEGDDCETTTSATTEYTTPTTTRPTISTSESSTSTSTTETTTAFESTTLASTTETLSTTISESTSTSTFTESTTSTTSETKTTTDFAVSTAETITTIKSTTATSVPETATVSTTETIKSSATPETTTPITLEITRTSITSEVTTSITPETTPTSITPETTPTSITSEATPTSITSEATTTSITPETTTTSLTSEATPTSIIPEATTRTAIETTTTESISTDTSPSTTVIPILPPAQEADNESSIVQISQNSECVNCDNTSSEILQSVEIQNDFDKNDLEEALHRLKEGEQGHCVIETIYSQNGSNSDNSSWYYMNKREIVWMHGEEEFQSDIHIGFGLMIVLPLLTLDGQIFYVVLMRTFVDEPASPIVQIYQSFIDRSACGCTDDEENDNTTHEHGIANVIQHFTLNSNYSHEEVDMDAMTEYIEMLFAVPEHQRKITEMVIVNEIEGDDCETTTSATTEYTTPTTIGPTISTSESSTSTSTTETTTATEFTTLASTTETLTTTTSESTSTSTTTESTMETEVTSISTPETTTVSTTETTKASATPETTTTITSEATTSITSKATPTPITSEATTSITSKATPTSVTSEATPTSITPEATPTSITSEATPTSITSKATPTSITSEATTTSITPETTTTSLTSEATPTSITPEATTRTAIETTTTESISTETSPSTTVIPILPPAQEADNESSIVQISQNSECVNCDNTSSEILQSVEIQNDFDKNDLEEALHRLKEGEQGHCVIETIYSQNDSNSDNSSWYYMNKREIVWLHGEEEFQGDIHIGFGLMIVLPLLTLDGQIFYVVLMRTFVDEPASPIVQIYQSFIDRSACGCIDGEENDNTTHEHGIANVIQHFTLNSNYSHEEVDMDAMTDYIEMLFAVPEHQRKITEMVIVNEIEGDDCETTTSATTEYTTPTTIGPTISTSESSTSTSTTETTTATEFTTLASTTETLTTTTSESTATSTTTESTTETEKTTDFAISTTATETFTTIISTTATLEATSISTPETATVSTTETTKASATPETTTPITSEATPTSLTPETTPTSITSEATPTSITSEATPTSITSEATPTSITSEATPTSITSEATPTSITSEATPTSTTSEATPTSTTSKATPTSTTSEATPTSITSEATPTSTTSKATPTSTTSEATPTSITSEATPTSITSEATTTSLTPETTPTSITSEATPTSITSETTPTSITSKATPTSITSEATTTSITPETTTTSLTSEATPTSTTPEATTRTAIETTTTESISTETSPSTTVIPILPPAQEADNESSIVQISQNSECVNCDNTSSEILQSVEIQNDFDKNDLEEALHRLKEGEQGHCVIETIYSQNGSNSDNSSWYYMNQREIVWMHGEEEFQSDIHIGFGLMIVLPLLTLDGQIFYVVLMRTFVDEPASPIVQIYQSFIDRSACGCIDGEENYNTTHEHGIANVIQHFTL